MKKNLVYSKAYQFAIKVVDVYRYLVEERKELVLSKHLLENGTSIGLNILRANEAVFSPEKLSRTSLAYQQSTSAKYWLTLLRDTGYIDLKTYTNLYQDVDEITKMLLGILKTTKATQ